MTDEFSDKTQQACVGMVTAPNIDVARSLASGLVSQHLVACVNLVPAIESIYWWQGEVAQESEVLLVIKTTRARWPEVQTWVVENHPYEVPEVIQLPIVAGHNSYIEWIFSSTLSPTLS